jgi:Ser/Thr protein kinase RdoA (MazF antagonist)
MESVKLQSALDGTSAATAARQALSLWGLSGADIEPIKVRENAVYRVIHNRQSVGALRVHRPGYHDDDTLHSEFIWMRALAAAGISVPRALPSIRGADFEVIRPTDSKAGYQVDILEWIEGRQLGVVGEGVADGTAGVERQYEAIGCTMGRIHNHAESWVPPTGFKRHSWDAAGLVGEQPFWGRFWELSQLTPAQRSLMQRTRTHIAQVLSDLGRRPDRYGLIHADLIPENILVDGTTQRVIDFDDAGFGWHLFDVATSLYFLADEPYYEKARNALVRGYRKERDLPDSILALLPIFLAARGTTYLGWLNTRQGSQAASELGPLLIRLGCTTASLIVESPQNRDLAKRGR